MKIYFTCSTSDFKKYEENYFKIRDFLVAENHILTRDWLPHTKALVDSGHIQDRNIKQIYKECMKAIQEADLVIIEDTISNFSTGHQVTIALQRQKPTLVLWANPKQKHFASSFIQGVESDYLEFHVYNDSNYQEIIKSFINKYENAGQRNRFHLVLDDVERKYLDWAQFKKEKSRTKLIRDALRKSINEDDDYQKYLSKS